MAEAIAKAQEITGKPMNYSYIEINRIGDHIWWISDLTKFKTHYPKWIWKYGIDDILTQIFEATTKRVH